MVARNFQCKFCKYNTNGKGTLLYHKNVKHHICMVCSQKFENKLDFQTHFSQAHPDAPKFRCDKCDYTTIFKLRLEGHVKSSHKDSKYKPRNVCNICNKTAGNKQLLAYHKYLRHDLCMFCEESFADKDLAKEHLEKLHGNERLTCDKCEYRTFRKINLAKHMKLNLHHSVKYELISTNSTNPELSKKRKVKNGKVAYTQHCKVCKFTTRGKGRIIYHENVKHNICMICYQIFDNRLDFERHFSQEHPEAPNFKCKKCDYETIFKERLEGHLKSSHKIATRNICNLCGSIAGNKKELAHHKYLRHNLCKFCDKSFDNQDSLHAHFEQSHRNEKLGCEKKQSTKYNHDKIIPIKNEEFETKSDFDKQFSPTPLESQSFECDRCDFKTISKMRIDEHNKISHNFAKHKFRNVWNLCNSIAGNRQQLANHKYLRHNMCMLCDESFATKDLFKVHVEKQHANKKLNCQTCDYVTFNSISLKKHMLANHSMRFDLKTQNIHDKRQFHCNVCKFKTKVKCVFLYHRNVKHNTCMICSEEFANKSSFDDHFSKYHSEEPKYECEKCDYKTIFKIRFNAHSRTAHNEPKQNLRNVCNLCGSIASNRQGLTNHQYRKHNLCMFCEKIFDKQNLLERHLEQSHSNEKLSCEKCDFKTFSEMRFGFHLQYKHSIKYESKRKYNYDKATPIKKEKLEEVQKNPAAVPKKRIKRGMWIVKLERIEINSKYLPYIALPCCRSWSKSVHCTMAKFSCRYSSHQSIS